MSFQNHAAKAGRWAPVEGAQIGGHQCLYDYVLELLLLDELSLKIGPGHVTMHIELRHCACALCSS